jgi:hypothetical protein
VNYLWLLSTIFTWVFTLFRGALTPTIALSVLFLIVIIKHWKIIKCNAFDLIIFSSFLLVLFISTILNINEVKLTHLSALIMVSLLFYVMPLWYMRLTQTTVFEISKICASIALFYAFLLIFEFSAQNFFGVSIRESMPIFFQDLPDSKFLGNFYRARGFSSEPGHAAFSLTVLALLGWGYRSNCGGKMARIIWLLCIFLGILVTASPVPFVLVVLSVVLSILVITLVTKKKKNLKKIPIVIAVVLLFIVTDQLILGSENYLENQLIGKLSSYSMQDRLSRLDSFSNFLNGNSLFFGLSPGASPNASYNGQITQLSIYPLILMEVGLVGFSFMCLFIVGRFVEVFRMNNSKYMFTALTAIFYVVINGLIISNYYYPAFWLPFLYAGVLSQESSYKNMRII